MSGHDPTLARGGLPHGYGCPRQKPFRTRRRCYLMSAKVVISTSCMIKENIGKATLDIPLVLEIRARPNQQRA